MEDTIKIELLTPLTGTFLPNEMEQDWEGEEYHELEEEQVLFDGADLIPYVSEIQEKIAEYSRVGHEDDKTDNLMDYFDGSAAIKEKVLSAVPSVKEADGVLYGCTILELKEYLETEELSELCEYLTGQYSDGWLTMTVGGIPVLAAGDPLSVINNLSTFIFSLIRAIDLILLGFGVVQVGLSLKSHDPSQRANGFLTLAGGVIITFAKEILDLIVG